MTRDDVKKEIALIFKNRYDKNFYDIDESLPLASLLDLDDRIDSLEIMEFMFDIEDRFNLKNEFSDPGESKISDLIDIVYYQINKK